MDTSKEGSPLQQVKQCLVKIPLLRALIESGHTKSPRETRKWVIREALRRSVTPAKDHCANMLLSYPRSGNHLVRFVVEHCSGQPTLGWRDKKSHRVPVGLHDNPIFLRDSDIRMRSQKPILIKRHSPDFAPDKLIYLVRNPLNSILSQKGRGISEIPEHQLAEEAEAFLHNCSYFSTFPAEKRFLITLESILENPSEVFSGLLDFLGIEDYEDTLATVTKRLDSAFHVLQREAKPELHNEFELSKPKSSKFLRDYFSRRTQKFESIALPYKY